MHLYLVWNMGSSFSLQSFSCLMDEVCNFLDKSFWSLDSSIHLSFAGVINVNTATWSCSLDLVPFINNWPYDIFLILLIHELIFIRWGFLIPIVLVPWDRFSLRHTGNNSVFFQAQNNSKFFLYIYT